MNQTGFNLFTALVAIVLVVLAALLAKTMVDSESKTSNIISDIEEEQKMQTIADLAKADALQAFNFGIRFTIERWLTKDGEEGSQSDAPDGVPDNRYVITPEIAALSWDEIKKDFARTNFGICEATATGPVCDGKQLATRAANHLTALLEKTPDVRGYSIDLDAPKTSELQELLQKVFDKSSFENDFFKVIDCDGTWAGCGTGTFYINLNLKKPDEGGYLTDEEYEKFPQIVVTNRQTGRVLKEPILPRGDVQIFVPLRLFKAIAGGMEIAKRNSSSLFEEGFKSKVDALKVGVCNSGCAPLALNGLSSVEFLDYAKYACAGDTFSGAKLPLILLIGLVTNNAHKYDPNDTGSMNDELENFVRDELLNPQVNELADSLVGDQEKFKVWRVGGNAAADAQAIVISEKSRRIQAYPQNSSANLFAFCAKVRRVEAIVVFEDSDEKYIVSNVGPAGTNRYAVRIIDTTYSQWSTFESDESLPACKTTVGEGLNSADLSCIAG